MNVCPNCDTKYDSLGIHWNYCGHPKLPKYKKDLLTGGLLSDATLTKGSGRPQFTMYNTNKRFLEWYANELGFLSNGVRLYQTGEEKHEKNIEYGFDVDRDANYKDLYCMTTVSHPFNEELYNWYSSGDKQYPDNITLTSYSTKVWYCGDGNVNWDTRKRGYCEIGCNNEARNSRKIISMFDNSPVSVTFSSGRIRIYGDSSTFLTWIGASPPGMEYKWEINDRDRYNRLR